MKKHRSISYQVLFWVFIFVYVFDYFKDDRDNWVGAQLAGTELLLYMGIAYVNLLVLIPKFYSDTKKYLGAHVVFVACLLLVYGFTGLEERLMGEVSWSSKISFVINYVVFALFSYLYWYVEKFQKEQQRSLELQNEKLLAEVSALKSQVSPHFLFNSLNNIYSLCLSAPDTAADMVEKLSEILRYLLYEGPKERVLLGQEMKMINDFIEIQKMKKLKAGGNISVMMDGANPKLKITPLLLISLIENVFKHGDLATNPDGFLTINLSTNEDVINVELENSYQLKETKDAGGIGHTNVQKQLALNYPGRHNFKAEAKKTFIINLSIDASS